MKNKNIIAQVKDIVRAPYTFPGGYPKFLLMNDSECLCHQCAKENYKLIVRSTGSDYFDGWQAYGVDINWEDNSLYCDNCGEQIKPEYGDE